MRHSIHYYYFIILKMYYFLKMMFKLISINFFLILNFLINVIKSLKIFNLSHKFKNLSFHLIQKPRKYNFNN